MLTSAQGSYRAVSSRDHLKLIKRRFDIGTWIYNVATDRFDWSHGLRRILRLETATGNVLSEFLDMAHPDDREALDDKIRTGVAVDTAPLRMTAADGAQLWLQFHMEVIYEDKGPHIVYGGVQDVTTIQNAHFASLQRRRLSLSLASMLDAIIWYVSRTGVLDLEVGWCKFTGTKRVDNNGYGWLNCIHPDDRDEVKAVWETAIRTKSSYVMTHRIRRSDGTYHLFRATGAAVLDEKGEIIELIGFARPVFEEERPRPALGEAGQARWTPEDYRCARAVLGWSVEKLSMQSGVSASTLKRMESEDPQRRAIRPANHDRLRAVFEGAGIRLSWEGGGVRVIRRHPQAGP